MVRLAYSQNQQRHSASDIVQHIVQMAVIQQESVHGVLRHWRRPETTGVWNSGLSATAAGFRTGSTPQDWCRLCWNDGGYGLQPARDFNCFIIISNAYLNQTWWKPYNPDEAAHEETDKTRCI